MKSWKTSSATYETRNALPSFRLDPHWCGYGPVLPLGMSRKTETGCESAKLPRREKPENGSDLAKKAREGRIVISLKPFRWNPAGNQSRPVEPDQQPEASLAWWVGDHPCEA